LGALLQQFPANQLAYIKPCTQCEEKQLVTDFCNARGISTAESPIIFYSGFTRSFLAGEQGTSAELILRAVSAVRQLSVGKRLVVVDGVGYPAVGSICGISNAAIAQALGSPVLLIGKRGVGDAVDSFNLNACFFESKDVTVLGAVFNRLPVDGYYALPKCEQAVTQYFQQFKPHQMPYGFLPELKLLETKLAHDAEPSEREARMTLIINEFSARVNVQRLFTDAQAAMEGQPGSVYLPDTGSIATLTQVKERDDVEFAAWDEGAGSS
jgi:dethiobiotin synthetase